MELTFLFNAMYNKFKTYTFDTMDNTFKTYIPFYRRFKNIKRYYLNYAFNRDFSFACYKTKKAHNIKKSA